MRAIMAIFCKYQSFLSIVHLKDDIFTADRIILLYSSEVISADIFDTFFKLNPRNAAEGRRYRRELLEKGGSRPEMETVLTFLGRKPNPAAFYKMVGLAQL
jgi:hypothetical protein